ncbi:UPF0696 protein C11orf68 homolog isoform X1 [Ambystoma mexicanum]|uniref:UPF0696 protein C11orf68 homolog isoform X1 n=2 Tax=Ambystoma mexicanum TaxID=8296 RepID=UPI0037E9016F
MQSCHSTLIMGDCEEEEVGKNGHFLADDYAAESMAADMDPWLIFDGRKTPRAEFEDWLETNRPSRVLRYGDPERSMEAVGWIAVYGPNFCPDAGFVTELQEDWERLQASGRHVTFDTIKELALNHKVVSGKWLMHLDTGFKVDHAWRGIATLVVDGRIGVAKVSPCMPNSDRKHVICVYNEDFTVEEQVMDVDAAIRSAGIKCSISYKPDVYTYLGIYRNNRWRLCPTIYESKYDLECIPRRSRIINKISNSEVS